MDIRSTIVGSNILSRRRRWTTIEDPDDLDILDVTSTILTISARARGQKRKRLDEGEREEAENTQQQDEPQLNHRSQRKSKSTQSKRFSNCKTLEEVYALAREKVPLEPPPAHILLPDEVLISKEEVQAIVNERKETVIFEYCDFPQHMSKIERLSAENQALKQNLTNEKVRNADLAGRLAKYKALAERVVKENDDDNGEEALMELVGGLIAWRGRAPQVRESVKRPPIC